jgi:hypothetical protein
MTRSLQPWNIGAGGPKAGDKTRGAAVSPEWRAPVSFSRNRAGIPYIARMLWRNSRGRPIP